MSVLGLKYVRNPTFYSFCESIVKRLIPLKFELSLLFAVPKQKVTHSRKRMRMATKQLQNLQNITNCPRCGHSKLLHNLCWECYGNFKKSIKIK